jgi:ferredoxin-thioredoxin reductase catalytic subunit
VSGRAAVRAAAVTPARSPGAVLQRSCGCSEGRRASGKCESCAKKKAALQRAPADSAAGSFAAPPVVHEALRTPGQALDRPTRAFMEARIGHDLARVRIHADAKAAESARAVHALAYTVGHDVVFAANQYSPHSQAGRHLLTHELVHVVQQRNAPRPAAKLEVGAANDPSEREADRIAASVSRGETLASPPAAAPPAVRRWVHVHGGSGAKELLGYFDRLCPGKFAVVTKDEVTQIVADCKDDDRTKNKSCACLCDVAHDQSRIYTIKMVTATTSDEEQEITGPGGVKAKQTVPQPSAFPFTHVKKHPETTLVRKGSAVEFGHFDASGKAVWVDPSRILAHELCGHARLGQIHPGEDQGCRPAHDATITTENEIAAEHGESARGFHTDRRRGESFYNPVGKRGKIGFYQCDGKHFEAP